MITVKVYNQKGEVVGEEKLNPAVFGVAVKPSVIQQVVVAQQANSRQVVAHTKDRSQVRGGGKKPWRQKGTGRARHGSIRSPLWRGGGVTFGPTSERNFRLKVNRKVKRKALAMVLSDRLAEQKLLALDTITVPAIKTKQIAAMLVNLKLRGTKTKVPASAKSATKKITAKPEKTTKKPMPRVLLILDTKNENVRLSARNIDRLETINVASLNVLSVLKNQYLVAPVAALKKLETVLTSGTK